MKKVQKKKKAKRNIDTEASGEVIIKKNGNSFSSLSNRHSWGCKQNKNNCSAQKF